MNLTQDFLENLKFPVTQTSQGFQNLLNNRRQRFYLRKKKVNATFLQFFSISSTSHKCLDYTRHSYKQMMEVIIIHLTNIYSNLMNLIFLFIFSTFEFFKLNMFSERCII